MRCFSRVFTKVHVYKWYTSDEFIEVFDDVAEELFADRRYNQSYERDRRRRNARSLDAGDGTEAAASLHSTNSPEAVLEMMEVHCRLCRALNSLPDIQGRRIEAHYILGRSQAEIAKGEGVTKGSVSISIKRGLAAMKKYLKNGENRSNFCP